MGAPGACNVCSHRERTRIDAEHLEGAKTRALARAYGLPEATVRRHLKRCRPTVRPEPARPALPPDPPPAGTVSLADLRRVAAELGLPLAEFVTCVFNHLDFDITTADRKEREELLDLWGAALENEEYVDAVARG